MIKKVSIGGVRRFISQPRTLLVVAVSTVFILSFFHHTVNFWGLTWEKQLLIVALIPLLAVPIHIVVTFMWGRALSTSWKRWLLFLVPCLLVVAYLTWRGLELPLISQTLEITARENSGRTQVQLLEIRDSYGAVVKFSKIQELGDWAVQDQILTSVGTSSSPLRYMFLSSIRGPIKIRFLTSPAAGDVEIKVNGKSLQASLFENGNGQRVIQIVPRYGLGIPGTALIPLAALIDSLAILFLCIGIWLIQEIHQTAQPPLETNDDFSRREYRRWLGVLLAISFVMHAANYFAVPLFFGEDSPGYIDGAAHWAKYHNWDGASAVRGPGTSLLVLPVIVLFGRNPWALKLLLHLLAYASVPLAYHLGWQLTRKYGFAFLAGLVTAFTPDLMLYSNMVMSEVPNVFIVLLFSVFLLAMLEKLSFPFILATMLVASFSVLIRTENLVLLLITVLFLLIQITQRRLAQRQITPQHKFFPGMAVYAKQIGFALILAALPILWWSTHNYQQHGFFGLSNYAAEVFYTGWVYGGEASQIPITDQSSPAVRLIREVYWSNPNIAQQNHVPTGWMIYFYLVERGFTSEKAFSILRQAAIDSITKDYRITWQVILVKVRDTLRPEPNAVVTFPLPSEKAEINQIKAAYFDDEKFVIPSLVVLQRRIYDLLGWHYSRLYPVWAWFCAGAMLLSIYRKPVIPWLPIVLITLFRVGLPNFFGLANWRFVISGLPLMQILALAVLYSIYLFVRSLLGAYKNSTRTVTEYQRMS